MVVQVIEVELIIGMEGAGQKKAADLLLYVHICTEGWIVTRREEPGWSEVVVAYHLGRQRKAELEKEQAISE